MHFFIYAFAVLICTILLSAMKKYNLKLYRICSVCCISLCQINFFLLSFTIFEEL